MTDILLGLANQLGGEVAKALPLATYDSMVRAACLPLRTNAGSVEAETDDDSGRPCKPKAAGGARPSTARSP